MALGGGPALLWSAEDMDPPHSECTYVPTQMYKKEWKTRKLTPLALHRLQLMSATESTNATVGNIYIGNCMEPASTWGSSSTPVMGD